MRGSEGHSTQKEQPGSTTRRTSVDKWTGFHTRWQTLRYLCSRSSKLTRLLSVNEGKAPEDTKTIRHPSCGARREPGVQLSQLAQDEPVVDAMGVIKETGADDKGLMEFHEKLSFFTLHEQQVGYLSASFWWQEAHNVNVLPLAPSLATRHSRKGVRHVPDGSFDHFIKGGILIIEKCARLGFVYAKLFGEELDTETLDLEIDEARRPVEAPTRVRGVSLTKVAASCSESKLSL